MNGGKDRIGINLKTFPPKVSTIEVNNYQGIITVVADRANRIEWIMDGNEIVRKYSFDGRFIAEFNVKNLQGIHVSFRLIGDGGNVVSQPFKLIAV